MNLLANHLFQANNLIKINTQSAKQANWLLLSSGNSHQLFQAKRFKLRIRELTWLEIHWVIGSSAWSTCPFMAYVMPHWANSYLHSNMHMASSNTWRACHFAIRSEEAKQLTMPLMWCSFHIRVPDQWSYFKRSKSVNHVTHLRTCLYRSSKSILTKAKGIDITRWSSGHSSQWTTIAKPNWTMLSLLTTSSAWHTFVNLGALHPKKRIPKTWTSSGHTKTWRAKPLPKKLLNNLEWAWIRLALLAK